MRTVVFFLLLYAPVHAMLEEDSLGSRFHSVSNLSEEIEAVFNATEPDTKVIFAPLGYEPMKVLKPIIERQCKMQPKDLYPIFALSQNIAHDGIELVDDVKRSIVQKYSLLYAQHVCVVPNIVYSLNSIPRPQECFDLYMNSTPLPHECFDFKCACQSYTYHYNGEWRITPVFRGNLDARPFDERQRKNGCKMLILCFTQQTRGLLEEGSINGRVMYEEAVYSISQPNKILIIDSSFETYSGIQDAEHYLPISKTFLCHAVEGLRALFHLGLLKSEHEILKKPEISYLQLHDFWKK